MEPMFEAARWLWAHWPLMVVAAVVAAAVLIHTKPPDSRTSRGESLP